MFRLVYRGHATDGDSPTLLTGDMEHGHAEQLLATACRRLLPHLDGLVIADRLNPVCVIHLEMEVYAWQE